MNKPDQDPGYATLAELAAYWRRSAPPANSPGRSASVGCGENSPGSQSGKRNGLRRRPRKGGTNSSIPI